MNADEGKRQEIYVLYNTWAWRGKRTQLSRILVEYTPGESR